MTNSSKETEKLLPGDNRSLLKRLLRERSGKPRTAPLSFAQERLWFLDQLLPASPIYNLSMPLRLPGRLDREALRRSLDELVRRHEILRTKFSVLDGQPMQVVEPARPVELKTIDLRTLAGPGREAEAGRMVAREAERLFDLRQGPLFRVSLLRLAEEDHVLVLNMHHIVSDGWSMGVLVQELSVLYQAFAAGHGNPLSELPIQYADYAQWQRRHLRGEVLEKLLSYWKEQLEGMPRLLELPTDRPRPAVQSVRGAWQPFAVDRRLSGRLKELGQEEGATLFMVLLAAFKVLLYRYTGQAKIVVGTPIANRNRTELEGLIGFFVNTLVLATDLEGEPTYREALSRVREVTLGAYAHQDMPFEKLVEAVQPERHLSHTPLFQVMFTLQNFSGQDGSGRSSAEAGMPGGAPVSGPEMPPAIASTSKFDLSLAVTETGEGLTAAFEYSTDLFDEETVRRMAGHYRTLLERIAADPEGRVTEVDLLPAGEKRKLLSEWAGERGPVPHECVHEMFEAQADRNPEAEAVAYRGRTLTYRELDRRANRLAHHLRGMGVGPEVRVGVSLERSLEMVAGVLGILKAGGAYVPLDPTYPRRRLAFMLKDAGVSVLVTQEGLRSRLPLEGTRLVCLDADREVIAGQPSERPRSGAGGRTLAYVIFTSGSTGRPKGVMVEHRGLCNLAASQRRIFQLGPEDRTLQFASLSFDVWMWDFLLAFGAGATLCVAGEEERRSPRELLDMIGSHGLTTITLTPSVLATLPVESPPALRTVIVGAEVCTAELVDRWSRGRRFFNGYGPTETSVTVTMARCDDGRRRPTIGRPLLNTQIYILDPQMRPVPVGVPGEVYVGGMGVARGYHRRPDLTAERFVPDPFGDEAGARLYRTGDQARYLADGEIDFIGRRDGQVKLRGYRIELGEIEATLVQHPAVVDGKVTTWSPDGGQPHLVAYAAVSSKAGPSVGDLRRYLKQRLPDYMTPAHILLLEELPRNANGKVDVKRLTVPQERPDLETDYRRPEGRVEEALAGIWQEVLGVEQVGVHDNFFDLGGHSLLATQVASRIRAALNLDLPLRRVFEAPTIREMAEMIKRHPKNRPESSEAASSGAITPGEAAATDEPRSPGPPEDGFVGQVPQGESHAPAAGDRIRRRSNTDSAPMSYGQQSLWVIDQMQPGSPAYIIPAAFRSSVPIDADVMESVINEIVRRHEVLRATFEARGGSPVQSIAPELRVPLRQIDLNSLPAGEKEPELQRIFVEESSQPFDLSTGPLLRCMLVHLAPTDQVLITTLHHIVSDAWSMGILFQEIAALYPAFHENQPSPLAELPIQYPDFAEWQRRHLSGDGLKSLLQFWKTQLDGAPSLLTLPTDRPRPKVQTFRGSRQAFVVSREVLQRIKALGRSEGATLFMTLLSAFKVLLFGYSGQDDIVVGSPVANRNRAEIERLIGFFVNTLVLRAKLRGDLTFRELLRRVRDVTLEAYGHQDLPFERLVDALHIKRNLAYNPVFQVLFNLQNTPTLEAMAGDPVPQADQPTVGHIMPGAPKFDVELGLTETANGLVGLLEYNTDLFDHDTMRHWAEDYRGMLEDIILRPESRLDELSFFESRDARHRTQSGFDNVDEFAFE